LTVAVQGIVAGIAGHAPVQTVAKVGLRSG